MKTFKRGGIHPPENKKTKDSPVVDIPVAAELRIMLSQCIGAPSKPIVKPGDKVAFGQLLAEAGGFVSARIHSPVNGTVKKIEPTRTPQGIWQDSIVIETDPDNPGYPEQRRYDTSAMTPAEIIAKVAEYGIVGMGGATFPTHVKLTVPEGRKAEYILINGAECEPCLTCDDALMRIAPDEIIEGAILIRKATGADRIIIGIEENKPEAIETMTGAASSYKDVEIVTLKKRYPQGGEKQLIYALTGRTVPAGALPIETGCIVDNVATAHAIYNAVVNGNPLTERLLTVTGPELRNSGNFRVRIGTTIADILEYAGGVPENTGKIIAGGPMMGRAISSIEATSTKGLSGLVVLPQSESLRKKEGPCIRCARCVSACPMGLEPYLLMLQSDLRRWDDMAERGVMNCLECGCCSYICPSHRPLLDMIKLGKQELRKKK